MRFFGKIHQMRVMSSKPLKGMTSLDYSLDHNILYHQKKNSTSWLSIITTVAELFQSLLDKTTTYLSGISPFRVHMHSSLLTLHTWLYKFMGLLSYWLGITNNGKRFMCSLGPDLSIAKKHYNWYLCNTFPMRFRGQEGTTQSELGGHFCTVTCCFSKGWTTSFWS